jgi:tetratricopeptide (TPR) repeat protein
VESPVAQHFTWRKAILGGVAAFTGLAVVAGAYTAMRVLGIGPVGTLVASGALAERDRVILADFENRTADSTLGGSLTEALRVDLSQSPTVRLMDVADVADALVRMQRPQDTRVTPEVARELAERSGVKALVIGQVDPVGTGYVLSASLLSAADGRSLVSVRETAEDAAALLAAIDRLSGKLRERIGESLVSIRANPPLERVTTRSLPALRKYSEGARLIDLGLPEAAIPVLEEAIALDSNFAMAWRKLAVAVGNSLGSREREAAASSRSYQLRDRLPGAERDLAVAYYYGVVEGDLEKEAAAYRSLLQREPDNATALNNLALTYNSTRRYAAAESLATRALRTGTAAQYLFQLIVAQIAQGHFEDARATVARALDSLPPGTPAREQHPAFLATALRDYAAADSIYRRVRRESTSNLEYQTHTAIALSALAEMRGRVREALQYHRERMATAEARELPEDFVEGAAQLALTTLRYGDQASEALAGLQAALARHPLDAMPPGNRPYLSLARVYAAAGKVEQARRLLREYETTVPAGVRRADQERAGAYGAVLEAEGRLADAAAAYREWQQVSGMCMVCGIPELAQVYDRMGQADSARVLYERFVATPSLGWLALQHGTGLPATYKRLGELYEASGDRKRAAEYYGKFFDLWKDADPDLQPGVTEVRRRLGKLAQEPGS